ncbi:MAG: hypothetical protein CVV56_02005 [Tenericutes bacterium HGW-Tenericutes-1]|jgi:hypothetical protein|nr:MAG: hypothetical protein CVV56_02005 [Tenericutes bacterium HGW-Tenericutes-1]
MKKIIIMLLFVVFGFNFRALDLFADDIYYPFDSITIIEAYKFDVQVTTPLDSESLLFPSVELNDILTIYVGTLEFIAEGVPSSGSSTILIVSDADGNDLARFLVNNYGYTPGVSRNWGFASHILIDPLVGVHKDMSIISQELIVIENIADGTWSFIDNKGTEILALVGTYEIETGLSIQISAYTELEEE